MSQISLNDLADFSINGKAVKKLRVRGKQAFPDKTFDKLKFSISGYTIRAVHDNKVLCTQLASDKTFTISVYNLDTSALISTYNFVLSSGVANIGAIWADESIYPAQFFIHIKDGNSYYVYGSNPTTKKVYTFTTSYGYSGTPGFFYSPTYNASCIYNQSRTSTYMTYVIWRSNSTSPTIIRNRLSDNSDWVNYTAGGTPKDYNTGGETALIMNISKTDSTKYVTFATNVSTGVMSMVTGPGGTRDYTDMGFTTWRWSHGGAENAQYGYIYFKDARTLCYMEKALLPYSVTIPSDYIAFKNGVTGEYDGTLSHQPIYLYNTSSKTIYKLQNGSLTNIDSCGEAYTSCGETVNTVPFLSDDQKYGINPVDGKIYYFPIND